MPTPWDTLVYGGYQPGYGGFGSAPSNWSNETLTEQFPEEAGAFSTAYGPTQNAQQAYFDMLERKLIGEGRGNINRMLAERGMGVQGTGQGAQLEGLMRQNIGIARAGSEMENARQIATQRYATLNRPTGRTIKREGWQAPGGGSQVLGGAGGGAARGGGGGGAMRGGGVGEGGGGSTDSPMWGPGGAFSWYGGWGGGGGGEEWNRQVDARQAEDRAKELAGQELLTRMGRPQNLTRTVSGRQQVYGGDTGWNWA